MNRRERQLIERRSELLAAALALFEEKGFVDTSMEEIAARADVARATLYNHFASKGEVVLALATSIAEEWLHKANAKLNKTGSPVAAIREVLLAAADWFDNHPDSAGAFFYAMREIMTQSTHESPPPTLIPLEWIIAAQKEGELTAELPAPMQMHLLEAVLRHHMIDHVRGKARGRLHPVVKKHLDVLINRLSP